MDFKRPHEYLTKLSETYGNVFHLRLGRTKIVVVCGYKMVKEAIVTNADIFVDRPYNAVHDRFYSGTTDGLFASSGEIWKTHRRFALSTLRTFGLGKNVTEQSIIEELLHLLEEVAKEKGAPFHPGKLFNNAASNIICQLVMGRRYDYSDHNFSTMHKKMADVIKDEGSMWGRLYDSFPWLMKHLPGPHNIMFADFVALQEFLSEEIKRHQQDLDHNNPRDYIDSFLIEMENHKESELGFTKANLVLCSLDLFAAGTETTSITLQWALIHLIRHPEIQKKVQAEIDQVIGQNRLPSMSDRPNMPYTDAVIHEVQRIGNIVPLNLLRAATKDTVIGGHVIPKGTTLLPMLTSVLFDKNEWETPDSFNPGHFLDSHGRFVKRDAFLPFSAGKRVCLGEGLAKMELFLFLVGLLQKFSFSAPDGVELSTDSIIGTTSVPKPFKIHATLSETYGNIFSLRLGKTKIVVVCGYKMVKEAIVNNAESFMDRPYSAIIDRYNSGTTDGIFASSGEQWKTHRRFALSTLRTFGFGKNVTEQSICEELLHMQEEVAKEKGAPFHPAKLFNNAASNIICQLVMGRRYDYADHNFSTMLKYMADVIKDEGSLWGRLYEWFPWLMKHLPGPHNIMFANFIALQEFLGEEIKRHQQDLDHNNPRDYIDSFLIEMENHKESELGFTKANLVLCSLDLFAAGTETTSTTLQWALIHLIRHPEIQKKVQAEIDQVIGQNRLPSMSDRPNMPYTDAVIHEIQRFGNIVPLNILRSSRKDTMLGSYFIPKGTTLLPMLTSVLFDKNEWETPDSFNPGHFLDSHGRFVKRDAFLPFSAGKRVCLGEGLAKMELFLFLVGLFQKFSFSAPDGVELSTDSIIGTTNVPKPFKIHATVR
ncbi:cytochrome P450 2J6-like [Neosynchiropus ocellatus]